jgi:arylsulfatase A-like enzyme
MPRQFAFFLLLLAMLPARAAERPNFLFILSDDHAAHALSCYGSVINQTPNLDRIATSGMRFGNCFVVNSICTPSRAAILTGKYSHKNGVTVFNRFDGSQPHVSKFLQAAGYQTALVGKWHLFSDPTGFDYWNVLPGQGLYHDPVMIENGRTNKLKGYTSDLIGDFSLGWLKKRDVGKPFCLMMQPKAPHREWSPPAKYTNLFANTNLPLPATFNDDYATRSPAASEATMRMRDLKKTDLKAPVPEGLTAQQEKEWRYQRYIKDYLRVVQSMDDNVGRVLDYLESSGLRSNTVVIYTSDQGFFLGDHGWFDKRFMYEESLRMPLLISWPGHIKPGSLNDAMVLNVDFAPTLLELACLPVPADMHGRSFAPMLRGERPAGWRTSMYYRYYHYPAHHRVQPHYGVRTERHKLIYFDKLGAWELFDLAKDPHELKNVYDDPGYASTVAALKDELAHLRKELDDRDQFANLLDDGDSMLPVPLELVFKPDPATLANGEVRDASAKGHNAKLTSVEVVAGRKGRAFSFAGDSLVAIAEAPATLNPARKPFTVGAWCKPKGNEGVVISLGGAAHGFSLYVEDGIPCAAVRAAGQLATVRGKEKLAPGDWTHLAAILGAGGELQLLVNGKAAGSNKSGGIQSKPRDGLALGADPGSHVGAYNSELCWRGLIEDVRLYWGELDPDAIEDWSAK